MKIQFISLLTTFLLSMTLHASDPLFDFDRIHNEALDAKVLSQKKKEGCIIEEVEYTAEIRDGKPLRIYGILSYPQKRVGKIPAVMWSQGGMARASDRYPLMYAKRGYFCMNVTLPFKFYKGKKAFDAKNPKQANFSKLAMVHMRAITYLTQRKEVDADRIGTAGGSYGGFFSTLVGFSDRRVKAGMSIYYAGYHHLGTTFKEFTQMTSLEDVEVWKKTIDAGWRLKKRKIPFMWGIAGRDKGNCFLSVMESLKAADNPQNRIVIAPLWDHGMPHHHNETLYRFLDHHLMKNVPAYNQVEPLTFEKVNASSARVRIDWKGEHSIQAVKFVLSPGEVHPWRDWNFRYHHEMKAKLKRGGAELSFNLPDTSIPYLAYATIISTQGIATSSTPLVFHPKKLGITKGTSSPSWNYSLMKSFEDEEIPHMKVFFRANKRRVLHEGAFARTGEKCIKVTGSAKLWGCHQPGKAHRFSAWVKAGSEGKINIKIEAKKPYRYNENVFTKLWRGPDKDLKLVEDSAVTRTVDIGSDWTRVTASAPAHRGIMDGYTITLSGTQKDQVFWVDDTHFSPESPDRS